MRPRVVFVLGTLGLDGTSTWQLTLLRHLDHSRYDVQLLLLNRTIHNPRVAELLAEQTVGVTELGIPTRWSWRAVRYLRIRQALQALHPDVVINSTMKVSALIRLAAWSLGIASINIYHSDMPHFRRVLRVQDRLTRRWSAHCVGVSRKVTESIAGVDRSRRSTIYNCVESRPGQYCRKELLQRYDLRPNQTLFLNVGRLQPVKNQLALIEAFGEHCRRHPEDVLLIAGWGPSADRLASRIEQLRIDSNVRLLGPVDDVWSLYRLADFFVLPSISEGFGIALLEAMGCGLPLVVTDLEVFQEILDDNGVLISGTDAEAIGAALERARTLPASELERMKQRSLAIYQQRFDPRVMARQYEQLIDTYAACGHAPGKR